MKKLWDKGYELNKLVDSFTVNNDNELDEKLIYFDCIASLAHAKMLFAMKLITKKEMLDLQNGLNQIIKLDKVGKFKINKEHEDCHTAIEIFLTECLGEVGKKIHTARSRNDQVLVALRLYYKDRLSKIKDLAKSFIMSLKKFSNKYGKIELPGYTHMRKAMPTSVKMWAEAFIDSMDDNLLFLDTVKELIDQSPLGSAAGYGLPIEIDRELTSSELGFSRVQKNPIYAQYSRGKFEISLLHSLSQIMLDLNKISTDLILFSMDEFGYIDLPDEFCTGSSIMPQKKNPDVLELIRGKYHLMTSYELQVSMISSNNISGYNRDVQLTKESVMNGFSILAKSLEVMTLLFQGIIVNKKKCKEGLTEDLYATSKVYKLVQQGVPFRDAYKQVAESIKNTK